MAVTGEFDASIRAVLTALRRPRSERQLTDTIAAFASLDSRFSANVARVLVEAVNPSRATSLGEVPAELQVSSEVVLRDETGREVGSVDLVFADSAGDFVLLVEAKLHSEYGFEQVERYLSALPTLGGQKHPTRRRALGADGCHPRSSSPLQPHRQALCLDIHRQGARRMTNSTSRTAH